MKKVFLEVKLSLSERVTHKHVSMIFDTEEIPDLLSQICDTGFYDEDEAIFYPANRIYEIKVSKYEDI